MLKAINSASVLARPTTELNANAIRFLDEEWLPCRLPTFRTVVTLADQDGINFLERCEAGGITLKNCREYIREWIMSQKSTLAKPARVRRNDNSTNRKISGRNEGVRNGYGHKLCSGGPV